MRKFTNMLKVMPIRADGRSKEELRELVIKAGVLKNAEGSAYVKMGNTVAVAGVYGPRELFPKFLQNPEKAHLKCRYNMAPFSTKDRKRPGQDRRSQEISKVVADALEAAIFTKEFPKVGIDIYIEILQGDAGTRCAGINAASVALADAGIPMRGLIAAVAAGKVDGDYVLDLTYNEEEKTKADIPVAYMPSMKKITLLQMDGDLSADDLKNVVNVAIKGCEKVYEAQVEALKNKYTAVL
ncbi:MAG: exosome complex exonuclease Rrp41 [Candidatus Aenigmarchaeota archaeon]|nr:exosome complex exonuclease Rrp41 [Candidatus Aenigmarchaeota archaeon]